MWHEKKGKSMKALDAVLGVLVATAFLAATAFIWVVALDVIVWAVNRAPVITGTALLALMMWIIGSDVKEKG